MASALWSVRADNAIPTACRPLKSIPCGFAKLVFMKRLLLLLLSLAGQAGAADFAARVAEAKAAAASLEGAKYDQSLWPYFGTAIRTCVPPGSSAESNVGDFVLVANISSNGKLEFVDVEPVTVISTCFAAQLEKTQLPVPPKYTQSVQDYPMHMEMRIKP